jgi:membrane-bound lytic murein transglycosylase D
MIASMKIIVTTLISCCYLSFAAHASEPVPVYSLPLTAEAAQTQPELTRVDPLVINNPQAAQDLLTRLRAGFSMPVTNNYRVQRELQRYRGQQAYANLIIERARPFLFLAVTEAERRRLPVELALLPVIESAYDPTATSRSQAAGLWQFIPSTGTMFGLKQNQWFDGRRDPLQSTLAAYDYLDQLFAMFNDWELVLAAYNAGPGTVSRAIQRNLNAGLPTDYWSLQLPQEAMEYVPRFIAVTKLFNQPEKHGVNFNSLPNEPFFHTVETSGPINLHDIARNSGIAIETLKRLNTALKNDRHDPAGPFLLHLPTTTDTSASQISQMGQPVPVFFNGTPVDHQLLARAPATTLPVAKRQDTPGQHQVELGDTLYSIARAYLTSVTDLQQRNPGIQAHSLEVGHTLRVPELGQGANTSENIIAVLPTKIDQRVELRHRIQNGETLDSIRQQYDLSLSEIRALNGDINTVRPGQTLVLRVAADKISD